jgi:hypothetical protein
MQKHIRRIQTNHLQIYKNKTHIPFPSIEIKHFELKWKKKLITRVGDQLVNHNCIKNLRTNYFVIIITFVGIHFSSLLFQFKSIHTFLTWKKKVGVWWPIEAFCMELEKKKIFQKLSLEMEISKPKSFCWNGTT